MRLRKRTQILTDEKGAEIPLSTIAPQDVKRHEVVTKAIEQATELQEHIVKKKKSVLSLIDKFLMSAYEDNGIKYGGDKGNLTLFSFDKQMKVVIQAPEDIRFNEQLQVALKLIRECLEEWVADGRDELKVLLQDVANLDRQGRINRFQVFRLRRIESKDVRWQKAQRLIQKSIEVISIKKYIRFYIKDERGNWDSVNLNFSDL